MNPQLLNTVVSDTVHIIAENEVVQFFAVVLQAMFLLAAAVVTILNRKKVK